MSRFNPYDPTCCLNCGTSFSETTKYCPTCGQKNRKNELTLAQWLREALSTFFHLEGRTANTLRDLFVPGKIATNIFNGHRQRYVHPFRLLVFSSLICFALMSIQRNYLSTDEEGKIRLNFKESGQNIVSVSDSNSTKVINNADLHPIASKMKAVDLLRSQIIQYDRFQLIKDSLARAGAQQDSAQSALLDTLGTFFTKPDDWISSTSGDPTTSIVSNGDTVRIDPRDVASLNAEQVIAKSDLTGWFRRLVARKGVHAFQEGSESISKTLYSSLSWAILIYVPFLALGFKLFYRRKLPLYTQHLTYASILMSIALILYGFSILIDSLLPFKIVSTISLISFFAYSLWSDSKVFQVKKRHALAKFIPLGFYGIFAFGISIAIWFIGTMLFV